MKEKDKTKIYNVSSGYSLVVTHQTTKRAVRCSNKAERTGRHVFNVLWAYVRHLVKLYTLSCCIEPVELATSNLPALLLLGGFLPATS
jgi:hypothetical protein